MADDAHDSRPRAWDQRWQGQHVNSAAHSSSAKPRRYWLIALSGIFLALLTVLALWALLLRDHSPVPTYLSLNIAEHNDRLFPPLASTRSDAERILVHFPSNKRPETKDRQLLRRELAALKDRPQNEPLILHLTAQAIVRDQDVYLIPGDAQPEDESTWLSVRDVLDAMGKCGAKHRLLILDLAHDFVSPRLGVLADRVAETLETILTTTKPSFPVLCPCSAGQYSLTAEVTQGTVFAYYLDQGLQGYADADKDRSVSVKEIAAFLEARVDRWARGNRGLRQRPRLFFAGADFVVANVNDAAVYEAAKTEPYPERLQTAWTQRDSLRGKAVSRAPRLLRKLEANLLRQEMLWRGGANQKLDWKALDEDAQTLLADLNRNTAESSAPPRSLGLAIKETKDNQAFVDGIMTILANTKDSSKKDDVNEKLGEALLKKLQEQKASEFPELAANVVEALSLIPQMKPDDVRVVQKTLLAMKPRERFVENLYLQRLIQFADKLREQNDPETWAWHADKTQLILQTMRAHLALLAALNREPGLLPWLADAILEADKLRQAGERKLLLERPSAWKEGFTLLQSAKRKYDEVGQTQETLLRGRRDLDRAYAELPGYGRLICAWPDFDPQAEKAWFRAAAEAAKLQAFFLDPPAAGASANVPSYDSPFTELAKVFKQRMQAAGKDDAPDALQQIHCLLELPFLNAKERAALLARQHELAANLHEATDKLDQEDNELGRIAPPPARKSDPGERNIGLVRARMTLALLKLAGYESKTKIVIPAGDSVSAEEYTRIERALAEQSGKDLVATLRRSKSLPLADALSRVVSPWETELATDRKNEPSRRLHQAQRTAFYAWLAVRYDVEAALLAANPQNQAASTFYTEAARELRLKRADAD